SATFSEMLCAMRCNGDRCDTPSPTGLAPTRPKPAFGAFTACSQFQTPRSRPRLADADVVALDQRSAIVAQSDCLGAQGKGTLLPRFDEGKTATAGQQEIGGTAASVRCVLVPARNTRLGSS